MALNLWREEYPGIYIDGNEFFFTTTVFQLDKLKQRPIGADLLRLISRRHDGVGMSAGKGIKCVIRWGDAELLKSHGGGLAHRARVPEVALKGDQSNFDEVAHTSDRTQRRAVPGAIFTLPTVGTSSAAYYDPFANFTKILGINTPKHIALGHELIHCLHYMSGDTNRHTTDGGLEPGDTYLKHEEARTIGLGIYTNNRISENALREEWEQPRRTGYLKPGDCDDLTPHAGS